MLKKNKNKKSSKKLTNVYKKILGKSAKEKINQKAIFSVLA